MNKIVLIISFFVSAIGHTQCNSILIEQVTDGGDGGQVNFWVLENESPEYDCQNDFRVKHMDEVPACQYYSIYIPGSFSELDKMFYKLDASVTCSTNSQWGCLQITMYDETDSLIYQRYVCCGEETSKQLKKMSKKRIVKKRDDLKHLFKMLIFTVNATDPKKAVGK